SEPEGERSLVPFHCVSSKRE
ncbi:hypothetical protein CSUI_011346, partial [Cystoisospora suis]